MLPSKAAAVTLCGFGRQAKIISSHPLSQIIGNKWNTHWNWLEQSSDCFIYGLNTVRVSMYDYLLPKRTLCRLRNQPWLFPYFHIWLVRMETTQAAPGKREGNGIKNHLHLYLLVTPINRILRHGAHGNRMGIDPLYRERGGLAGFFHDILEHYRLVDVGAQICRTMGLLVHRGHRQLLFICP